MNLDNLTREDILCNDIPLTELLKDSVYYPASDLDGRPIEYCNTCWRDLGVNSFVYCDFNVREEALVCDLKTVSGYSVLAHRRVSPKEYIPDDFCLELPGRDMGHYFSTFLGKGQAHPFAHWVVFERNPDRDESHGPERFSLLFVGGEGLATFQKLYCYNHIAPKMICFIQCWGFAGNWTDFTAAENSFHRTILRHKESLPEWLCMGNFDTINGEVKLRALPEGVVLKEYVSRLNLRLRAGSSLKEIEKMREGGVYSFSRKGRSYIALSIHHCMDYAVYDVTDSMIPLTDLREQIIRPGVMGPRLLLTLLSTSLKQKNEGM